VVCISGFLSLFQSKVSIVTIAFLFVLHKKPVFFCGFIGLVLFLVL
jgi:hypothetical protein